MILTCPSCATSYHLDEKRLGPGGRVVRCAQCQTKWRAEPEALDLAPAEAAAPDEPAPALTAAALPKSFREEVKTRRKVRQAAVQGVMWGSLAACFAAAIGGAMVFRADVVRAAPKAAGLYALVGLPVNPTGLTIEGVRAEPALQDGRDALRISGVLRNVAEDARVAPPLRVALTGDGAHGAQPQVTEVAGGPLAPGAARPFSLVLFDPPTGAKGVEVTFALDMHTAKGGHAAGGHGASGHAPTLRQAQAAPAAHGEAAFSLRGAAEPAPVPQPVAEHPDVIIDAPTDHAPEAEAHAEAAQPAHG